jgi:hypothetical protein
MGGAVSPSISPGAVVSIPGTVLESDAIVMKDVNPKLRY